MVGYHLVGTSSSDGSAGINIDIALDSVEVCRGLAATGKAILRGGDDAREINRFVAELQEHYLVSTGKSTTIAYRTVEGATFGEGFQLAPGQAFEGAFEFMLPALGHMTSHGRTQGWSIHAFAGISWAKDPWTRTYLDVLPEPPIQAMNQALDRLGFIRIDNWADANLVGMNRRPPAHWEEYLDGICFRCQAVGNVVQVWADVNWQERGIVDILKAMVRADHTSHEFSVNAENADAGVAAFLRSIGLPA
jgi:sporulation-control protein spo0M